MLSFAIIGSGPSGFYAADALLKTFPDCRIDVLDRLPTPFGLIRAGVAPDHQGSKKIAKVFERTALQENVRFIGNITINSDVSLAELRTIYDAVILATGAPLDRKMDIPGEDKKGVYGSAAVVGWYNGHPDFTDLELDLAVETVVVIGVGNVALDIARVFSKTAEELADSDIAGHAIDGIHQATIKDIHLFGRRGPIEAAFTHKELREQGELQASVALVDPDQLPDEVGEAISQRGRKGKEINLEHLRRYGKNKPGDKPHRVHLTFYTRPVEILGGQNVEGIRLERTRVEDGRSIGTGETYDLACQLVIPCIGYQSQPLKSAPFDYGQGRYVNIDGRIEKGLYVVGWAKRGPTGVISTNHPDGVMAAQRVAEDITETGKPGPAALDSLLCQRKLRPTSYDDWKKIEAAEVKAATPPAPRRKLATIEEMLEVLD